MKLKTARIIINAIVFAFCAMPVLYFITYRPIFLLVSLILIPVYFLFVYRYWRCPFCGGMLGASRKRCDRCGKDLNL